MELANYADVINCTNPDRSRHGENPEERTGLCPQQAEGLAATEYHSSTTGKQKRLFEK
jgi:hypothetical protein